MHELSFVQDLVKLAETELSRAGCDGEVVALKVKVGYLSGVNPDAMRFAFEVINPSTRLNGAQLEITEVKAICDCNNCGGKTEIERLIFECPLCGNSDITIKGGREIELESIKIEEPE